MPDFEIGKQYNVDHTRKGKFQIEVTYEDNEWVTGVLIQGKPQLISSIISNGVSKGEEITIRKSLSKLTPIQ